MYLFAFNWTKLVFKTLNYLIVVVYYTTNIFFFLLRMEGKAFVWFVTVNCKIYSSCTFLIAEKQALLSV